MKKLIFIAAALIPVFAVSLSAATYCDMAGDTLAAWNVQVEYKEKYFEYNTYYNDGVFETGIMLRGMDQDFVVRMGLPGDYFVSLGANYIFQNLEALYDYNNVQSLTLIAGRKTQDGPGLLCGLKYPLGSEMADNPRLINRNDMYNFMAGVYQKGSLGPAKYSVQGILEQPFRQTDYRGTMDLSASLGFSFYDDPQKQAIDIITEVNYTLIQRGSADSYRITVIPQAVVRFYNDFGFVLGVEILADADNWTLNQQEKLLYVVKANYVLNSARKAAATALLQPTPVQSGFIAQPAQSVTVTGTPVGTTGTPAIK